MNRISTVSLTLTAFASLFSVITACASGGDDPADDDGKGGMTSGGSGNGSGSGNLSGSSNPSAGSSNPTAGSGTSGSASGGSGGSGSGVESGVCKGATFTLPAEEAYIDNFEDTTRFEGWYSFSDTDPPNMPGPERVPSGALETGFAGHVTATGIKSSKAMGYGAGFGFGLVDPAKGACVDLVNFDGISFWAKGTVGADNVLKFQVVAPATQPTDSMPPGDCTPKTACAFAHPAKTITITEEWKQFVIKFSELAPAAPYTGKVLGFNMINDGPDYDVEIDEVTFFKGDAPTTPVEPAPAM